MAADLDKNQIVPALDDVRTCIRNKSYEEALTAIKSLTGTFHEVLYLSGSEEDAYLVFDEEFERVLHELRSGDEFRVITADIPFTETASLCAEILMDLDRPDEARSVLRTGLRRAPESFRLTAEYADTFRRPGELEEFFRFTLEAFRTAFRSRDVARCFRNLGYFF